MPRPDPKNPLPTRPTAPGASLVRAAIEAVTGHIRERHLRVGDVLPGETHFASTLGVSRAVVREAFGALAALRLVEVANGRRPRVAAVDGSVIAASLDHALATAQIRIADVWDVRRTIETRTAALAATARTDAEAAEIVELAATMAAVREDPAALARQDIAFHEAIARASHNALFVQIVVAFEPLMHVAVPAAWRTRTTPRQRQVMLARHRAIARAIVDGDPIAAAAAMEAHFDASIRNLLDPTTKAVRHAR